jgi:hypothetical protein
MPSSGADGSPAYTFAYELYLQWVEHTRRRTILVRRSSNTIVVCGSLANRLHDIAEALLEDL